MDRYGVSEDGLCHAATVAFMTLAMMQIVHAFSARSRQRSALNARLIKNAWLWGATAACVGLQLAAVHVLPLWRILHTVPLTMAYWGVIAVAACAPFVVIESVKLGQTWSRAGAGAPRHPVMSR